MSESNSELAYPADRTPSIRQVMMPRDTNALGTIFGGVLHPATNASITPATKSAITPRADRASGAKDFGARETTRRCGCSSMTRAA